MSEVVFDESVIEEARRRVATWVTDVARQTPVIRDVVQLVETLSELEYGYERARLNLRGLHVRGLALPHDYLEFDVMRRTVHEAQQRTVELLRAIFRGAPDALRQIPSPKKPPPLGQLPTAPATGAISGLGNPAAAAIPAWMVGTIVLGILAAIIAAVFSAAVIIAVSSVAGAVAAETIRDVWLGKAQLEAHNAAREARLQAFERCIAAGGSREHCLLEANRLVTDPPLVNPGSPGGWVPWVVGGLGLLVVAGGGIYLLGRLGGGRSSDIELSGVRGRGGSARPLTREQFLHEPDRYGLSVRDGG